MLDTSLRPVCFQIHNDIPHAAHIGPETFKKYEYILYFLAQITRFTHEDTGFAWYAMKKCLGLSNDIVNKVLATYDTRYNHLRKIPARLGDGHGRPMKSFSTRTTPASTRNAWATYISSTIDLTAIVMDVKHAPIKSNKYSILGKHDIIVSFKSTSTFINLLTDLKSQMKSTRVQDEIAPTGLRMTSNEAVAPHSFIELLLSGWKGLMAALERHTHGRKHARLFITGHSLGGVLATLFGFIMAEAKVTKSLDLMKQFDTIHIVSFGSPTSLNDAGRTMFNKHLNTGLMTYDRVVSQTYPSLISNFHSIFVGNDFVPSLPVGYSHPGYKPLITESADPERPYSMDTIRQLYGVDSTTRGRDAATWPFDESPDLYADKEELAAAAAAVSNPYMVGAGRDKDLYAKETLEHVPNFISVAPLPTVTLVHGEILGVINKSAHRTLGIKNPVSPRSTHCAFFSFCPLGVKIEYLEEDGTLTSHKNVRRTVTRKRYNQ